MDPSVDFLMILYTYPLSQVPILYYYLSWVLPKEYELCGWDPSTLYICSADFWEDSRYQSNWWTTIDKRHEYFVDDYVGLGLGVHNDVVCPIQMVSIIDVFPYHSKLIAIELRLLLVQWAWSIVTNKLVWVYEVFYLGRNKKWRVWCLCKLPQPK